MEYLVLDKKGISYTEIYGGELQSFPVDSKITDVDIRAGRITEGGIESLIEQKRIKPLGGNAEKEAKAEAKRLEAERLEAEKEAAKLDNKLAPGGNTK